MKKQLLLVLLMFLSVIASAEEVEINGLWYNLDASTNTAEVIQYKNNLKYSGDIVIPEKVTNGTLEYRVTSIGNSAFSDCSGLTSVDIPSSVISIGLDVFLYCSSLTSINVNANNATYDSRNNCNAIIEKASNTLLFGCKNTVIPSSVTTIGGYALYGCSGLTTIEIPSSVTSIREYAFAYTGLTSVSIPNSVTTIELAAFAECTSLTAIALPNTVKIISESMFAGCSNLSEITIPEGVTTIEDLAFEGCSQLSSITFPNSLEYVEENAFEGTKWYENQADGAVYAGMVLYSYKGTVYPNTKLVVKDGTMVIADAVFGNMTDYIKQRLVSVTFPKSLKTIGNNAFEGCSGLTSITIPGGVTTIGSNAFASLSKLETLSFGNNVAIIKDGAFSDTPNLTEITVKNSNPIEIDGNCI